MKINRTLFLHAGLGPKFAGWTIDRLNDAVRSELNDFTRLHGGVATDEEGPLWYRGLATGDETQLAPLVDELLKSFDVDRIVIGHSYAQAAITPRFGGKVVLIDIGLSRVYDNVGKLGCLEIEGDRVVAIHRGTAAGAAEGRGRTGHAAVPEDRGGARSRAFAAAAEDSGVGEVVRRSPASRTATGRRRSCRRSRAPGRGAGRCRRAGGPRR